MLLTLPVARAAGVSPRMPHLFLSFAGCHMQDHPREPEPTSALQALSTRSQQQAASADAGKKRFTEWPREVVQ